MHQDCCAEFTVTSLVSSCNPNAPPPSSPSVDQKRRKTIICFFLKFEAAGEPVSKIMPRQCFLAPKLAYWLMTYSSLVRTTNTTLRNSGSSLGDDMSFFLIYVNIIWCLFYLFFYSAKVKHYIKIHLTKWLKIFDFSVKSLNCQF